MNCPVCGMRLPDGSDLCLYCGSKIELPVNETPLAAKPPAPANKMPPVVGNSGSEKRLDPGSPDPGAEKTEMSGAAATVCVSSAPADKTEVDKTNETLKTASGDAAPKTWIVAVICLSVLLLASVGINFSQLRKSMLADNLRDNLQSEISELNSTISDLREIAANYNLITTTAKYNNLGCAAWNFKASESVIIVGKNETGRKFKLTAYWPTSGNIFIEYNDNTYPAATVDFCQYKWQTTANLVVHPNHTGVTVVTFSNSIDRMTFKIIIIVV